MRFEKRITVPKEVKSENYLESSKRWKREDPVRMETLNWNYILNMKATCGGIIIVRMASPLELKANRLREDQPGDIDGVVKTRMKG